MCFSAAEIAKGVNHVIEIDPEVSLGTHCDQVTLTYISCSSDFVVNLCSKMCFSATEIAVSVNHVIVIDPEVPWSTHCDLVTLIYISCSSDFVIIV